MTNILRISKFLIPTVPFFIINRNWTIFNEVRFNLFYSNLFKSLEGTEINWLRCKLDVGVHLHKYFPNPMHLLSWSWPVRYIWCPMDRWLAWTTMIQCVWRLFCEFFCALYLSFTCNWFVTPKKKFIDTCLVHLVLRTFSYSLFLGV